MTANSDLITCRGLQPRSVENERKRLNNKRDSTHRLLRHSRNDGKQVVRLAAGQALKREQ